MKRKTVFCLLASLLFLWPSARAGTKEEIMRLQSDVLTVQNQVREFEKTFTERTDGLKSLVVQLNDQVAKTNLILERVSKTLENQAAGERSKDEILLREIRALSGKMDDTATQISVLAQQMADLKVQAKPLGSTGASSGAPPEESIYNQAFSDYMAGNFDLAIQGFNDYLNINPAGDKAAATHFYIGDSYSRLGKASEAIAAFTRVINDYPGAQQTASALLNRGRAELAVRESDNAIEDFRAVVGKFPSTLEAERAKEELRKLGVSTTKPAAPRRKTR